MTEIQEIIELFWIHMEAASKILYSKIQHTYTTIRQINNVLTI